MMRSLRGQKNFFSRQKENQAKILCQNLLVSITSLFKKTKYQENKISISCHFTITTKFKIQQQKF